MWLVGALAALAALAIGMHTSWAQERPTSTSGGVEASVADYYAELERMGLIDVETGTKEALRRELGAAEALLRAGAAIDAAVALYAIVESPRFAPFTDDLEFQNAEYYLAVSLATAGAYDSALRQLLRVVGRGPSSMYFAPAHRRVVDIALETRNYQGVLTALEGIKLSEPLPPEATGERSYLRARIAYEAGNFAGAESELASIGPKSRLYTSAVYLRGVIRTRTRNLRGAAEAFCEIADGRGDSSFTFVVDDRYYTIKDLARLGLGRIAHEQGEYDDAYYHYFQIPEDSDKLPEALFEAAWSMYQKRELEAARELVRELIDTFPTSPLMPQARLLAGYIELADCKFDDAQRYYDRLVADLQPVVDELAVIRTSPERRTVLFERALERWRTERGTPRRPQGAPVTIADTVLGLLRLDPGFIRLHEAVQGMQRAAGDTPHNLRLWSDLGRQAASTKVAAVAAERTVEQEDAADANGLVEDVRRLQDDIARARAELRRGVREGSLDENAAAEEESRLRGLESEARALAQKSRRAAEAADVAAQNAAAPALRPLISADIQRARALDDAARALRGRLEREAARLAQASLDKLYRDTRRVLDKAKLGKIDAVIGQKRRLDIEVQDLAAGRWPAELFGRLWDQGMIGDDEEFWPFEGEFWADEYEGWR